MSQSAIMAFKLLQVRHTHRIHPEPYERELIWHAADYLRKTKEEFISSGFRFEDPKMSGYLEDYINQLYSFSEEAPHDHRLTCKEGELIAYYLDLMCELSDNHPDVIFHYNAYVQKENIGINDLIEYFDHQNAVCDMFWGDKPRFFY